MHRIEADIAVRRRDGQGILSLRGFDPVPQCRRRDVEHLTDTAPDGNLRAFVLFGQVMTARVFVGPVAVMAFSPLGLFTRRSKSSRGGALCAGCESFLWAVEGRPVLQLRPRPVRVLVHFAGDADPR